MLCFYLLRVACSLQLLAVVCAPPCSLRTLWALASERPVLPLPTPTPTPPPLPLLPPSPSQGELRPALPTKYKLPVTVFAAREVGTAIIAEMLRKEHGRIEPVERISIQPRGQSTSRTLFARGVYVQRTGRVGVGKMGGLLVMG